ncbi:MAG: zinc-binding dehydrogenase [Dehalococcoidia bacterium]
MRQILLEQPRHLVLAEAPIPTPASNDLLVEVKAAAICGTDQRIYNGNPPVSYPRVPGHEVTGVVHSVGTGVTAFCAGDRVVINPNLDCNNCERCLLGRENLCVDAKLLGRDVDGTLREFLTIDQIRAFKLPAWLSFEEGTLLQPLSTVVHAQVRTEIKATESVVVLGLGAAGLMHVQVSKLAGAYPVIAVGRSRWKLELAEQMGADLLVDAGQEDPVAQVRRLTGGPGADVTIESAGTPETLHQSIEMTKPGGRVMGFGISSQPLPSLDLYRMYLKEMTLIFARGTTRADFHRTVALVESSRLNLKPLVTQQYPLAETPLAFKFAEEEISKVLRIVMKT